MLTYCQLDCMNKFQLNINQNVQIFMDMNLKMSLAKYRPFCTGLSEFLNSLTTNADLGFCMGYVSIQFRVITPKDTWRRSPNSLTRFPACDFCMLCHKHGIMCQNRPESAQCWQHRDDSGPVLAHYAMFTGKGFERSCWYFISNDALSNNANQTVCANLYGVQI